MKKQKVVHTINPRSFGFGPENISISSSLSSLTAAELRNRIRRSNLRIMNAHTESTHDTRRNELHSRRTQLQRNNFVDLNTHPDEETLASILLSLKRSQPINSPIDVDVIDDEVTILSSSTDFPQARRRSRSNVPMTVILDEDSDVPGPSGGLEFIPALDPYNAWNSTTRTTNHYETYEFLESSHSVKRKDANKSPEPQQPVFICAVCNGTLIDGTSTTCGHIFCEKCIKSVIKTEKKCPSCNKKLTVKQIHRVYLPSPDD